MPKLVSNEATLEQELLKILPERGEEKKAIVKAMLRTRGRLLKQRLMLKEERALILREVGANRGEGLGPSLKAEQISERKKKLPRTPYSEWAGVILGPSEAADALGVSRSTLNNWKRDGEIIALPKGKTHSVIPMVQFEGGSILRGIKEVLAAAHGNNIAAWRWLINSQVDFDGDAPINSLREGNVEEVIRLAEMGLS